MGKTKTVKFVPYAKKSKKEKHAQDAAQRNTWEIRPYTRVFKDKNTYDRNKVKREAKAFY